MVHLQVASWYSFMEASSSPDALAQRATALDQTAVGLTDMWSVAGCVAHASACKASGIKSVHGAQIQIDDVDVVLLAADEEGYATLCDLLTRAHINVNARVNQGRTHPSLTWSELREHTANLFCLADLRRPVASRQYSRASHVAAGLKASFGDRFFLELIHHERLGDSLLLKKLQGLASELSVKCVAANAVRYATRDKFLLYDALLCAKHKVSAEEGYPDRACNDTAYLCSENRYQRLGFPASALANTEAIARECSVDLLASVVTPPEAYTPEGESPKTYLKRLCHAGFRERYPGGNAPAVAQLKKELEIIFALELEEFFLAVSEVMSYARSRSILCSGRGSAANSIVAYLLRITSVDPIEHKLLFERFLHLGRQGMPDIDCDFQSDRRDEVIEWIHNRWSENHTAMTANLVTFRLRSAVQEMAKILGFSASRMNLATKKIPSGYCRDVWAYRGELASVLGDSPALNLLCHLVEQMDGCPHYLGLHSGGMILSRRPLRYLSALQTSKKGVRQIQFNKDDVELRGEIKFDVLSLRALAAVAETLSHIRSQREEGEAGLSLDNIPLNDVETFNLICSGATLGLFQIESPGQWHLLAQTQPRTLLALTMQVALFRPGPLQAHMVAPFVARCRGIAKTYYPHPSLKPILEDTYGIILFQEQVLEIAHVFAGMSLQQADEFRRLMSKFRHAAEMEAMRTAFVDGAIQTHGVTPALANRVFDSLATFVGYGFCRSHAASFSYWVYITAYLKTHFPTEYLAGVLEHAPGFWPIQSFVEEAKHLGIPVLPVSIERSEVKYSIEYDKSLTLCIRVSFTAMKGITRETAGAIVLERAIAPFASLADAVDRLDIDIGQWETLARAGAFDCFCERRAILWQVRGLVRDKGKSLKRPVSTDQLRLDLESVPPAATLSPLKIHELIGWDFQTQSFTTLPHPLSLHRSLLDKIHVSTIAELRHIKPGTRVLLAGSVISRQRPPTAAGMCFIVLEDETDRIPTAVTPPIYEKFKKSLHSSALILEGKLEAAALSGNTYRSVLIERVWPLEQISRQGVVIGAAGFPGANPRFVTRGQPITTAQSEFELPSAMSGLNRLAVIKEPL